jgi:sulfite exporter TauE/SafE
MLAFGLGTLPNLLAAGFAALITPLVRAALVPRAPAPWCWHSALSA